MKKFFKYLSVLATTFATVTMVSCSNDAFDEIQPEGSSNDFQTRASSSATINNNGSAGVLVLEEGNMTSENGFINFIPGGQNQGYQTMVSGKRIANVCQDLSIYQDKIYVIAQNTKKLDSGGGILTVLDATNFEVSAKYQSEISKGNNPTHVAVYDANTIYIRASGKTYDGTGTTAGIYKFNPSSSEYIRLEDSKKTVAATPMVIAQGYLYVCYNDSLRIYNAATGARLGHANGIGTAQGVVKNSDGTKVYVYSSKKIYEIIPATSAFTANQKGSVTTAISTYSNSAQLAYYNNNLYYAASGTIYRFPITSGSTSTASTAGSIYNGVLQSVVGSVMYNGIAIDPNTGYLYVSTTEYGKTYSDVNALHVMKIAANGTDYEHNEVFIGDQRFTAGIFFPANFNTTVKVGSNNTVTKTPEKYDPDQFYY